MKKILTLTLAIFTLTSCGKINESIKRSANEKIFDTKGFNAKKRMPMYNKNYIEKAKKNVEEKNFNNTHDETKNPYYADDELDQYNLSNRKMYQNMAEMQATKQNLGSIYKKQAGYPKIRDLNDVDKKEQDVLKKEINEIKTILKETQEKLSNQKCPVQSNQNFNNIPTNNLNIMTEDLEGSFL